jgi:hypothetical protein
MICSVFKKAVATRPVRALTLRSLSSVVVPDINDMEQEQIKQANEAYHGIVEIAVSGDRGWGVFASRDLVEGERLIKITPFSFTDTPNQHSIQIDWKKHMNVDIPARFVNHCCNEANVGIKIRDEAADFYALRGIDAGDELLWDYETTEYCVSENFPCNCGSSRCRGTIRGYYAHGNQVMEAYGPDFIAPYLLKKTPSK